MLGGVVCPCVFIYVFIVFFPFFCFFVSSFNFILVGVFFYFQDYFIEKKRKKESAELEGCQNGENLGREKGGKMESDHTE